MGFTISCSICGQELEQTQLELCDDCKDELEKIYYDMFSRQPEQQRDIDQFAMDFESILSQNLFLRHSFRGNTAAFFGGYDGVGLLSNFFGEKCVLVIDFIPEVLEWWKQIGEDYGFEVSTILYDARVPVTEEVRDSVNASTIDAWRTDPPYNCAGIFCFLSRIFYFNSKQSPIFLCVPVGTPWSELLKHNVWKFLQDSGMKITDVSPSLYNYTHREGPDSFAWKVEVDSPKFLIPNVQFEFDIYTATPAFAESDLGCKQYERCRARRNDWDVKHEIDKSDVNNRRESMNDRIES